jgi:hypothetical protein
LAPKLADVTAESDVDQLVVADRADRHLVEEVRDATYQLMWNRGFDQLISVIVMQASDFEEQKCKGFSFVRNVEQEGIVLWPAA